MLSRRARCRSSLTFSQRCSSSAGAYILTSYVCVQAIVTSRVAVLSVGAAVLLAANVQTGNLVEDYYKGQAGIDACLLPKAFCCTYK